MKFEIKRIAVRCLREIRYSTSPEMLSIAYKYYRLFFNLLLRLHVKEDVIKHIDKIVIGLYKRKERELIIKI